MGMKYSVIVPHFSDFDGLRTLLASIPLARNDLEVLVIDDCSPNQELLECIKIEWPGVRWHSTHVNCGAGAARNIGLNNAIGRYIIFADSDDFFLDGAFNNFDLTINEDDQIVYYLCKSTIGKNGLPSVRADRINDLCVLYYNSPTSKNLRKLQIGHVNPIGKIYLSKYIEEINVKFEITPVANDVSFNVIAAVRADKIRVVPIYVYNIVRRNRGLTSRDDIDSISIRLDVLSRLNAKLNNLDFSERMHAGSYIYRSFLQGPRKFFLVLFRVIDKGLFWPTIKRISIKDLFNFYFHFSKYSKE